MRKFSSKVLLFGEYSIIHGSSALVIPFPKFKAWFEFINDSENKEQSDSNKTLRNLYDYVLQKKSAEGIEINLSMFKNDIENGIYFHSEIPLQYGLGSSGALVAAIFERYGNINNENINIPILSHEMAKVESFFHGKSSAIDPLCSFLNKPLFVQNDTIEMPAFDDLYPALENFFLLDAGNKSDTSLYMNMFLSLHKQSSFNEEYYQSYLPDVNKLYSEIIRKDQQAFKEIVKRISVFQLKYFFNFIPETIRHFWAKGIHSEEYFLKLCGSGGGGYFLVYSLKDISSLNKLFNKKLQKVSTDQNC